MKKIILAILVVLSMIFGMLPLVSNNVDGLTSTIISDGTIDGGLKSYHANNYYTALWGTGTISNQGTFTEIDIGQYHQTGIGLGYYVERGYLSFNTSSVSTYEEVISATIYIKSYFLQRAIINDFDVMVENVDYGSSLDTNIGDWNVSGTNEGVLMNTAFLVPDQWYSINVAPELINISGLTQYQLSSNYEGNNNTDSNRVHFYSGIYGGSEPYIDIVTQSKGEGMVQYWDEHIVFKVEQGFEAGVFPATWTTFGSPLVTTSYAPYEGFYHAGASISESGSGNHTFQVPVDATGLYNITVSYFRKLQDIGGGTVTFTFDWYNGSAWNILETFSTPSIYSLSNWELNNTADNNPNLIFRFNVTLTAGAINNGAWIDDAELFTKSGIHMHSNSTIYPVQITSWNNTYEQIRYSVYIDIIHPTLTSYVRLIVEANYTFQSIHPNTINVTDLGSGTYNITDQEHDGVFHDVWFLREKAIVQSEINIKLWHSTLGEGFFWEKWLVMINPGTLYDNSTASIVPNPVHYVEYGSGNWTITILDYFGNHIVNRSFVANSFSINMLIDVPVHTFKAKNLRRDTTLVSIYFNATGNPFTQQLTIDEVWPIAIREGTYMFVFAFLAVQNNLTYDTGLIFYYNLTVDGDYTAYIGSDKIQIIYTDVNGMEIVVGNILTYVIGDAFVNRTVWPITITDDTRSSNRFTADLPILIHPYSVVDAEVYAYENGVTSATFYRPLPTTGTVTVIADELTIMSDFDTQIYVNRTDGSEIINVTSPGIFDLTSYTNSTNFTFWSNNTASLKRTTHFQQAEVFYWVFTPQIGKFEAGLSLNNTGNFDWRNVKWYIGIPEGVFLDATTPGRLPAIYDMDNQEYWELGLEYKVDTEGFYTDFAFINSSVTRDIYLTFLKKIGLYMRLQGELL